MDHKQARQLLEKYLQSWLKQDIDSFKDLLGDQIIIKECNGPIYNGLNANLKWFSEWNKIGKVLRWEITDFSYDSNENKICFEWEFSCVYDGNEGGFSGCSFMVLNDKKFISIHEYKTESNHYYPYN